MARVCIICTKEPQGSAYKIRDDAVIKAIRSIKQKLGVAKNNELYVCPDCLEKYLAKRKDFEKNMVFTVAIAAAVFLLTNGIQIFYGRFNFGIFFISIGLAALILGLVVMGWTPRMENPPNSASAGAASEAKAIPAPPQGASSKSAPAKPKPNARAKKSR